MYILYYFSYTFFHFNMFSFWESDQLILTVFGMEKYLYVYNMYIYIYIIVWVKYYEIACI